MVTQAIPLVVLTGALGAGKTTLLGRCLADASFARTAVVIDELGEVEFDPHLLAVRPGPLKRAAAGRWTDALRELVHEHAGDDEVERVIVETNGITGPAEILESLATQELDAQFALNGIVAAVDAERGMEALREDALTRAQAMCADAVVLTKLDLADAGAAEALAAEIAQLNPYAGILRATDAAIAAQVWDAAALAPARELRHLHGMVEDARADGVGALTVRFNHSVELSGFCVRLAGFLEQHAPRVLRVKGLVRVQGRRGPVVIQAVGTTLYPVRTLKAWPQGVAESALVVVARDMPDDELRIGVESTGRITA